MLLGFRPAVGISMTSTYSRFPRMRWTRFPLPTSFLSDLDWVNGNGLCTVQKKSKNILQCGIIILQSTINGIWAVLVYICWFPLMRIRCYKLPSWSIIFVKAYPVESKLTRDGTHHSYRWRFSRREKWYFCIHRREVWAPLCVGGRNWMLNALGWVKVPWGEWERRVPRWIRNIHRGSGMHRQSRISLFFCHMYLFDLILVLAEWKICYKGSAYTYEQYP